MQCPYMITFTSNVELQNSNKVAIASRHSHVSTLTMIEGPKLVCCEVGNMITICPINVT